MSQLWSSGTVGVSALSGFYRADVSLRHQFLFICMFCVVAAEE